MPSVAVAGIICRTAWVLTIACYGAILGKGAYGPFTSRHIRLASPQTGLLAADGSAGRLKLSTCCQRQGSYGHSWPSVATPSFSASCRLRFKTMLVANCFFHFALACLGRWCPFLFSYRPVCAILRICTRSPSPTLTALARQSHLIWSKGKHWHCPPTGKRVG